MHIVIFITCAKKSEALSIADNLISRKLAACVNIADNIKSVFRWQGKVDRAKEILLIVKSKKSKLTRIIKLVRLLHSYKVPEIIALPVISGYKPYLEWIDESIR
ncbi:MAG: divalent-cation tolerance protein CutA [Candidatus Omnitrophota bacterium]